MNRRASDLHHGGADFAPRVGDLPHRGDELERPSAHFTTRMGEKQLWRPQLQPPVDDFKRAVIDIFPRIERIPPLAPHMQRSAP